jgi:hypothetical protein
MRRVVSAAIAAAAVAGLAGIRGFGQEERVARAFEHPRECSDGTLRGNYGIQIQGARPAGPGVTETVIGVVMRTYDGEGGFTQVANLHGSVTGAAIDVAGAGTYEVSPDCTGRTLVVAGPITIEDRLVIVDSGNEVRSATVSPAPSMVTGVQLRVRER